MLEFLINSTVVLTLGILLILLLKSVFKKWMTPEWHISVWSMLLPFMLLMAVPALEIETSFSIRDMLPYAEEASYSTSSSNINIEGILKNDAGGALNETIDRENDESGQQANQNTVSPDKESNAVIPSQAQYEENNSNYATGAVASKSEAATYLSFGKSSFGISHFAKDIILVIYAAGVFAFAAAEAVRYAKLKSRLSKLRDCKDNETLEIYNECYELLKLKKRLPLKIGADSSMLVGIFNKTVYIKEDESKQELKYILMHELCHYKQGDTILNLTATIGLAIFWFNPVMHIAFHVFRRDIEIRCDNMAIETLGERREYAEVLVRAAAGQHGFIVASTSFLGGEKEVVERVRRIAGAKKRKVLLEAVASIIIIFSIVACASAPMKAESVKVMFGERNQIGVPQHWLADMRSINDDILPDGSKVFLNKNGEVFAAAYIPKNIGFTDGEKLFLDGGVVTPHGEIVNGDEISDEDAARKIYEAIKNDFETKGFEDIKLEDFTANDNGENHLVIRAEAAENKVFALDESGTELTAKSGMYNIVAQQRGTNIAVVAAAKDDANIVELAELLMSANTFDIQDIGGVQISGIEEFENFEGAARTELSEEAYEKYVNRSLNDAIEWYLYGDYPIEIKVSEYEIENIEKVDVVKGSTAEQQHMVGYWYLDDARWDLIYPQARAYKVTYDLTPENEKYYKGETHFERIAVFVVNTYVSPIYDGGNRVPEEHVKANEYIPSDFYFLGFVKDEDAALYGRDKVILSMLDNWYTSINPMSDENYSTDYIGDAPKVGMIVKSLPLAQYIDTSAGTFTEKTIMIQTSEEPYSLTVNYTFNRKLEKSSDEIAFTPITLQEQSVINAPINAYVAEQLWKNINQLYARIGNVDEITINVNYVERNSSGKAADATYTIHTKRNTFYDYFTSSAAM